MKQLLLASSLAVAGTCVLVVADQHQRATVREEITGRPAVTMPTKLSVHAAGRVEGQTETVAIRPHFPGRIESVPVARGAAVVPGQTLYTLDAKRFDAQRELAVARLAAARAARQQLIDGARESEIESAKQNAAAADARYENARKRLERAERLFAQNAISSQELEDHRGDCEAGRALLMAAHNRYETIKADPRPADLMAAEAEIASAEAQLKMAQIDVERCRVVSPCSGVVLAVDINPGEWISPETPQAPLELVGIEQLRVVADVDERDALQIETGMTCKITADAMPGKSLSGRVSEIEPRMEPKKIYGGWAGERTETHARRIWIRMQNGVELPIGLPVEVEILPNGRSH